MSTVFCTYMKRRSRILVSSIELDISNFFTVRLNRKYTAVDKTIIVGFIGLTVKVAYQET